MPKYFSLFYCYCLTDNAQNAYCSIIIVWQTMLKTPIVLLSLFGKQCSKHLLFYYHCLANNAQNTYCSIIIVWQTMLTIHIALLSLLGKQCSKHLLFFYHCLTNNAQNACCLSIVCETITKELFQWLPSECSKHDVMFVYDVRMSCN